MLFRSSAADQIIARNNATSPATALILLSAPAGAALPADAQAIALALAIDDLDSAASDIDDDLIHLLRRK